MYLTCWMHSFHHKKAEFVNSRSTEFKLIWKSTSFFFFFFWQTSYEDGQVGDTSINTQDPGIHREILRVIGNQTATGWKSLNTIPLPWPLSQSWTFERRRPIPHVFLVTTNTHTKKTRSIFAVFRIHYFYCCPGIHAYLHWLFKLLPFC